MRYSVQLIYRIITKSYGCSPFAKNMDQNIPKTLSKKFSTDALKTISKRVTQKIAEATGDLSRNKIPHEIPKVLKYSQQNNSKTVTNEYKKEMPTERYISG